MMRRSARATLDRTCGCSLGANSSMRRSTVFAALGVFIVEMSRWPVSLAASAMRTVSVSRSSPTRMTSGSSRRLPLRALANVRVCVLTMYDDDDSLFAAMRAGAQGYLLKGAEQDEIADAIRAVVRGQAIFGAAIASRMLEHFANPPASLTPDEPFPELTARERDILGLLADGRRTAEIASTLHLSPKTVSNNLTTIFAKLEVSDRTAAVIRARERGLGS